MKDAASLALYRKYRSKDFASVIGQAHIVETLTTAIANGHLSHAYLFTGPRGVGKTTVARLLARALNCLGDPKPCNSCAQCLIDLGSSLDLIEIDAASNRRIDEIRELRDKIGLAPASGRFKVYIIDEVHMLTTEAFNALLKTLEEPPSHAVFILATTEAHKLPETIISRTQRFNFKPLGPTEAAKGLAHIAKLEQIEIDQDALTLLATAARGSLRDGISMLDQVSSNGTRPITVETVNLVLGWGEDKSISDLSMAIINGQTLPALQCLDSLTTGGTSVSQVISQLISRWRTILLAAAGAATDPDDELTLQARSRLSLLEITTVIDHLMTASRSSWPTLSLEAAIIRLTIQAVEQDAPSSKTTPDTPTPDPPRLVQPVADTPAVKPIAPIPPSSPKLDQWPAALAIIQKHNNPLFALLSTCQAKFDGDKLELICRFNFHRDRLTESRNRQVIEAALQEAYGRSLLVSARVEAKSTAVLPATATAAEFVSSALEILGGEVVDG